MFHLLPVRWGLLKKLDKIDRYYIIDSRRTPKSGLLSIFVSKTF